jgi:chitin-binding protein
MHRIARLSISLLAALGGAAVTAHGHGLIEDPPSRMFLCGKETTPDQIKFTGNAKTPACSTAFKVGDPNAAYNYMGVVTHTWGRSKVSPLPKYVCGFAGEYWKGAITPWDAAMDWPTNPVTAGPRNITWDINMGPHFDDTKEFKYWITKADFAFSPAKELSWDDFETEPFCSLDYDATHPTANPNLVANKTTGRFITKCNMPARNGHHVVYGEWGRTEPTIERFHGCFDAQYGATAIGVPFRPREPQGLSGTGSAPGAGATGMDLLGRPHKAAPGILPAPALPAR